MDKYAQMEAARLLANEFKSGTNTRRGTGNARGGGRGGTRGKDGTRSSGRMVTTSRSEFPGGSLNRPISGPARPILAVGDVNRAPIKVNPVLASWLDNKKTDEDITANPACSTIGELANISRGQPNTADGLIGKENIPTTKHNGLGKSIWADEKPTKPQAHIESTELDAVVHVDLSTQAAAMLLVEEEQSVGRSATYEGQVSRLLEADHRNESRNPPNKTCSNLQLRKQPMFGTMLWALQQLDADDKLPDPQQFKPLKTEVKCIRADDKPVAASLSDNVNSVAAKSQDMQTVEYNKTNESLMDGPGCHCPKRSHPVIGLAASKHNTDADGDIEIPGMSTAARNKFAVNVILQDHSMPDCPVLLQTMAKYPLYFGANPATVSEPNDNLKVTRWEDSHNSTYPPVQQHQAQPQHQPGVSRGLTSSIWAK